MKSKLSLFVLCAAVLMTACRQDMHDQPKYKSYRATNFFGDGRSERPEVADTVARGHLKTDGARYEGRLGGEDVTEFPFALTREDVKRGQERFNIYCSPCHSRMGDGQGMVVKRGYRSPPSYHIDRLRKAPVGHFFDVITNGFGAMPSYASRVNVDDRWRIIAYIRALQASQNGTAADVPQDQRAGLKYDMNVAEEAPEGVHEQQKPDMHGPTQQGAPERGQPQKESTQP